jgi:hypothetical protein
MSLLRPQLELLEVEAEAYHELRLTVEAYSRAHRALAAEDRTRLGFELLEPEEAQLDEAKTAKIFIYADESLYEGPQQGGVPHGTGTLTLARGEVVREAIFKRGRRDLSAERALREQRRLAAKRAAERAAALEAERRRQAAEREAWARVYNRWSTLKPDTPSPSRARSDSGRRRAPRLVYDTCWGCRGSGWVSYQVEEPQYTQTLAFAGTSAWRRGYSHVRAYTGYTTTRSVDSRCGRCGGSGRVSYRR